MEQLREILTTGVSVLLFVVFFAAIAGGVLYGLHFSFNDFLAGWGRFHDALAGRSERGERVIAGEVRARAGVPLLTAPETGAPAVAYRTTVEQRYDEREADGNRRSRSHVMLTAAKEVPYEIASADGSYAVSGKIGSIDYPDGIPGIHHDDVPVWVQHYDEQPISWRDWPRGIWVYEAVIAPGAPALVMGVVKGEGVDRRLEPPADGYQVFAGSVQDFERYYTSHADTTSGLKLGAFACFGIAGLSLLGALALVARNVLGR
jgi:hypothetical protein